MPVFLLSDFLWWLILICLVVGVWRIQKNPQSRAKWKNVFAKPVAMVSFVIFFTYVCIASLDSIHFKYGKSNSLNSSIISIFDWLILDISERKELTYSAPFAFELHSKITTNENDVKVRKNLPLNSFRSTDKGKIELFVDFALVGLLWGLAISAVVLLLLHFFSKNWDWRTRNHAYVTLISLICIFAVLFSLSEHFYIFGTDKVGNNVFIDALKGIRTAVLLGSLTTIVLLPLAIISGMSAGFFRGVVDDIIQYIYTTLNSVPGILLIASSVLLLQVIMDRNPDWFDLQVIRSDTRLILLCMILGLTSWTGLCRLLRAETLKLRSLEYVEAARSLGLSSFQLISKHILPNLTHIVLIVVVLDFSGLILAEAVLSYVGVGVDPTMPSWGNMINNARMEISKEPPVWWSLTAALVLMFVLVLATNLFADTVRQVFDPRQNIK